MLNNQHVFKLTRLKDGPPEVRDFIETTLTKAVEGLGTL